MLLLLGPFKAATSARRRVYQNAAAGFHMEVTPDERGAAIPVGVFFSFFLFSRLDAHGASLFFCCVRTLINFSAELSRSEAAGAGRPCAAPHAKAARLDGRTICIRIPCSSKDPRPSSMLKSFILNESKNNR